MYGPLVIALKRLVVPCISDRSLPPSPVDEVDVLSPEFFLRGFVKSLDPW
jgi:hypothetical protein